MKTQRAIWNILSHFVNRLLVLLFAVVLPKMYIDYFGSEVNGLLSSLAGIFVYLNLLEAGVGGASVQALYAAFGNRHQDKINGILSATCQYYNRTGIYFLACVCVIAFLYPLAIQSALAYYTVVALLVLSAVPFILHYFFLGKYSVLLAADNRSYVLVGCNTLFSTLGNAVKIVCILAGFDVIAVQAAFLVITIVQVFLVCLYIRRKYPLLDLSVTPDIQAISQKKYVLINQIAGAVFLNTDVLILTVCCGLKEVSVYTIYLMVFTQAGILPSILANSLADGLGQLYAENRPSFERIFNCFEAYYTALAFAVYIVAYLLILPFLRLYTAGVTDISYLDEHLPLLFLCVNLLSAVRWPSVVAITIAGHFKQTQWRAVLETAINLVVSLMLVGELGMYGVLLGNVAALVYRSLDMLLYTGNHLLHTSSLRRILRCMFHLGVLVVIVHVYQCLPIEISSYRQFAKTACWLFGGVATIYLGLATWLEPEARIVLLGCQRALLCKLLKSRQA